mgnify:CR=1 FL=1|uniref:TET-Associated Glycosyltransferase domain-containing protein n=1 Tax=uncultured marine virus TaxID=186617 RepID=A0A0F7L8Z1_9VIRU|nr:hypothetical protein [uncultured marine virus]
MNPEYPIYVISKGRAESRLTIKALEKMNVPFKVAIEPQEFEAYNKYIEYSKLLVLPFSNLGQGSIPVRNFCWEHSIKNGFKRHWILDDNILEFTRFNHNLKIRVDSGTIFRIAEIFTDRYKNIGFSGFNYRTFAMQRDGFRINPYYLNTRVYSCTLINNELPFRWRGLYNEDTDICLRMLKEGWCTVLFNAFLANKLATLTMKGGNTEEVYGDSDNRLKFAESLKNQHPEHVEIVWRYNRWHHEVNYDFKQKLIRVDGYDNNVNKGINEFGMKIINLNTFEKSKERGQI